MNSTPAVGHGLGQHEILGGRRRQSETLRRQVDARATVGLATVLQLSDDRVGTDLDDPHRDGTVAELHPTAHDEILDQRRIGHGDVVDVAGARSGSERDELTGDEPHASVRERPRRGSSGRAGRPARRPVAHVRAQPRGHDASRFEMVDERPVAQVEPDHVDAGIDQLAERLGRVARRPDGRHDLRSSGHFCLSIVQWNF